MMHRLVVFGILLCLGESSKSQTFLTIKPILAFSASAQIPVLNDGNDNTPISHIHYIASLQLVTTEEQFFCAGVFISQKAVLTLASCFYQK